MSDRRSLAISSTVQYRVVACTFKAAHTQKATILPLHSNLVFHATLLVPSGPPQNLKVSDCGAHYFQLIWQPPAPSDINDRDGIRKYTLYLDKKYINTTSDMEYTFDGLKKNRTYFVEVLAENDQGIANRNHAARRMVTTLDKRSESPQAHQYTQ